MKFFMQALIFCFRNKKILSAIPCRLSLRRGHFLALAHTARLAASEVSGNSCAAAASKATARTAMVLADVFKRANQRAGELAEVAYQARTRGMTCEQAYEGLADTP
jgi:hypothetical protein